MKVVLAFDSFKGSLSAAEACRIAGDALREVWPDVDLVTTPMADGGEGTVSALLAARPGEWIPTPATGPLASQCVAAGFGWLASDLTAVVEMASASGLTLLREDQLNPLATSTRGTGELLMAAAQQGARRILLAAGGSATVDGGMGAAHALGWRFLDHQNVELTPCGGNLETIAHLVKPESPTTLPHLELLADVIHPLCGDLGAARIFGPQKGATPPMVKKLERGLENLARLWRLELGQDLRDLPGGGAAGGLAAGAVAFFGAHIVSGIDTVMRETKFADACTGAAWVLTGEGSFDASSLHGKVVSGVLRQAREAGARTAVLAGRVNLTTEAWTQAGLTYAAALATPSLSTDEAIRLAPQLLYGQTQRFAREWL
jgi:glycerate kinase